MDRRIISTRHRFITSGSLVQDNLRRGELLYDVILHFRVLHPLVMFSWHEAIFDEYIQYYRFDMYHPILGYNCGSKYGIAFWCRKLGKNWKVCSNDAVSQNSASLQAYLPSIKFSMLTQRSFWCHGRTSIHIRFNQHSDHCVIVIVLLRRKKYQRQYILFHW